MKKILTQMDGMAAISAEWDDSLQRLHDTVEHHVEDEEQKIFPKARMVCSSEELSDLAAKMAEEKKQLKH